MGTDHTDRLKQGKQTYRDIMGNNGDAIIASLAAVAPDFADTVFEFAFGNILSRPGLSHREREIATIAALTAKGNAEPQLRAHIKAGLHVGLSRDEIVEIIIQMAVYAGIPAALNGLYAARDVFAEITTPSVPD